MVQLHTSDLLVQLGKQMHIANIFKSQKLTHKSKSVKERNTPPLKKNQNKICIYKKMYFNLHSNKPTNRFVENYDRYKRKNIRKCFYSFFEEELQWCVNV
ncbi:MAG: hypothetical protein CSB06_00405 [Bacteroidia bacterium]|nr:MAG: hypothetical protein CSB06_00405 [Bacteroidia bacterium]